MFTPKINVRYTQQLSLTYNDAKMLSQEISCINKEIKNLLTEYNFEYQSFDSKPLPLSESGLDDLHARIQQLYLEKRISLRPEQVFELVCASEEFLSFKQELKSFIASLRMEMRIADKESEFPIISSVLKRWIPCLCGYVN